MLSSYFQPQVICAIKLLSFFAGLLAAGSALQAARLWLDASKIELPSYDPPMTSIGDVPEHHILGTENQLNATADALRQSSKLNSLAARWAALAAVLTGFSAILGVL